jgi:hypothetical protein
MLRVFCLSKGFSLFIAVLHRVVTSWACDTQEGEKRVLGGQTEGKKPDERPRRKYDNTRMELQVLG